MKETGFLFDLDGVLIDSEKEYTRIWSAIDSEYPTGVKDFAIRIKGMTLTEILNMYYPDSENQRKVTDLLYSMESRMRYDWLPGARELLSYLRDNMLPRVLVTSSNKDKMQHLKDELPELELFFDYIITGDVVTHSKPNPEGYLLGASSINIPPSRCVVFEDSLQGVMAGKAAGATVVGVAGTLDASVIAPYADIVVESLAEIDPKKLIKKKWL